MNRVVRLLISVLAGVAIAAGIAWTQVRNQPAAQATASGFERQVFGGDFAQLTDQNGKIQDADAFRDRYQLVFFGFTHCPAICPGELHKVTQVMKGLTPAQRARLAPVFITVDPERDTPAVMKDYMAMFDPAIAGLTGSADDIKKVLKDWKVYAGRVDLEDGDYTMDHSTYLYFRDPKGWLVEVFDLKESPETITKAVAREINVDINAK